MALTGFAVAAENNTVMRPHLVQEQERLAALAPDFSSEDGFNARLIDFRFDAMRPFLEGRPSCVELGSADGRMTERLAALFSDLTAVDGTETYVEQVRRRLPQVDAVHSLFEDYAPSRTFSAAVLGHVLEHVAEPRQTLEATLGLLDDDGIAIVTVPNADSIHRQIGVAMGLLSTTTQLNEADLRIGHRRVYTRASLTEDIESAGLKPIHSGGVFLKPLSNAQMEHFDAALINAFYEVGKSHPELCAELMVVAARP